VGLAVLSGVCVLKSGLSTPIRVSLIVAPNRTRAASGGSCDARRLRAASAAAVTRAGVSLTCALWPPPPFSSPSFQTSVVTVLFRRRPPVVAWGQNRPPLHRIRPPPCWIWSGRSSLGWRCGDLAILTGGGSPQPARGASFPPPFSSPGLQTLVVSIFCRRRPPLPPFTSVLDRGPHRTPI